jgi:beta-lactam-binding protein with PASTA domain
MAGSRPPDVVGYTLEDARAALTHAGWMVGEVTETRPPRRTLMDPRRVVRQRVNADGSVELVVCGERSDGAVHR